MVIFLKVDNVSYISMLVKFLIAGLIISIIAGFIVFNLWGGNFDTTELVFFIGLLIVVIPKWYTQNDLNIILLTVVSAAVYSVIFYFLMPMIFGSAVVMSGNAPFFFGLFNADAKYGTLLWIAVYIVLSCLISSSLSARRKF